MFSLIIDYQIHYLLVQMRLLSTQPLLTTVPKGLTKDEIHVLFLTK